MTARLAAEKEHVPTVVFIGRMTANKRPEHAIRAFGLVRRQLPDAQMWVIGSGPEEARLRKMAGPGVVFLGRVPEEEKHDRLARAHALVATSIREGWGLVVTEAAASGTVAIGYDVPGLRDSIAASGGILTRADPASLATGMVGLLSSVIAGDGPQAEPAGVVPWREVAAGILRVARDSESHAIRLPAQAGFPANEQIPVGNRWLCRVRVSLGVLGVALLLLSSIQQSQSSTILVDAAFVALLAATLIGGVEGRPTAAERRSQLRAEADQGARGARSGPSRIGLAMVGLVSAIAVQSWFVSGRLIAGGDKTPMVGTAWLGRLFAPWAWSGSDLGGPAANETKLPLAAVYWLVRALHGSPARAEDIWYTALFAGAAMACYLLLRALRVGTAGSIFGALAYVFNAHVLTIGTNPVFLAAMVLLPGLPAAVLMTASGRWRVRTGILLLGASAPFLGYVSLNPPLILMILGLLGTAPLLVGWLDGRADARRALRTLALGVPLLVLASLYWLIPTVLQLKIDATSALASTSSWTWTEGRATLANGFWLNNGWAWKYPSYYPYAGGYSEVPFLILKFLLPTAAFGYLALARFPAIAGVMGRRGRLGIAASATALFFVLLSTGTRFPGAALFDRLYRLPLGWLLREPGRFLILGGLAYAVLFALTVQFAGERLNSVPSRVRRWSSLRQRPGLRLAAVSVASLAVLAPGYPLLTGAIAPTHRPGLPSTHVSMPAYWTAMASYLNGPAPPGNLLVLPADDYYQMPYTWGYYGADGFITNLIVRNVVDPHAQGYRAAQPELLRAVRLVQRGLLAHDWRSVRRTLAAIGTPLLLVRGDVNAARPGRHIISPAALDMALREDKSMRLIHRAGKLLLFALRANRSPAASATSYATVNSSAPDLRDLGLFPFGTALISSPMQSALPAVLQVPQVSKWRLGQARLEAFLAEPPGRRYRIRFLSATSSVKGPVTLPSKSPRGRRRRIESRAAGPAQKQPARLVARVRHRDGQRVEEFSYKLGGSLLSDGGFGSGGWGPVGNCAAFAGTAATARLAARVFPGQGPRGLPALALSANEDSACEARQVSWRSGSIFVSLWVRNLSGAAPRMCLWEKPISKCNLMPPVPRNLPPSHWYHYQAIVRPDPGTRFLSLFLYADGYRLGVRTVNEYSDVVVRRSPVLLQPVIVATRRSQERPARRLFASGGSFSSDWIGPSGAQQVEVDGLRNGWLVRRTTNVPTRYAPASWYVLSRLGSLLAAGVLLTLALSLLLRGRVRRVATAPETFGRVKHE